MNLMIRSESQFDDPKVCYLTARKKSTTLAERSFLRSIHPTQRNRPSELLFIPSIYDHEFLRKKAGSIPRPWSLRGIIDNSHRSK